MNSMMSRRALFCGAAGTVLNAGMSPWAHALSSGIELLAAQARFQPEASTIAEALAFLHRGRPCFEGPALRFQHGQVLEVNFRSDLAEGTTIHWHGMRLPNGMDGDSEFVQMPTKPGESWRYRFQLLDPGTHWFHSHHRSWSQVARGLYGMAVVENPNEPMLPEATLILDDWSLDPANAAHLNVHKNDWDIEGQHGEILTVNGRVSPTISVPESGWLRLRFLNASTARLFHPVLSSDDRVFAIAFDGFGIPHDQVKTFPTLGPGQRMDLLVNFGTTIGTESISVQDRLSGASLAKLTKTDALRPNLDPDVPRAFARYMPEELRPWAKPHQRHELRLEGGFGGEMQSAWFDDVLLSNAQLQSQEKFWSLNGVAQGWVEPLFDGFVGETVELRILNQTDFPHTMHLHGQHFLVIETPMAPEIGLFRDSITVPARESATILIRLQAIGWWPLHCHMLGHQAAGMSTWFNVLI